MADILKRVDEALGNKVELSFSVDMWTVRVIEDSRINSHAFPDETTATDFALSEVARLGLRNITRV